MSDVEGRERAIDDAYAEFTAAFVGAKAQIAKARASSSTIGVDRELEQLLRTVDSFTAWVGRNVERMQREARAK